MACTKETVKRNGLNVWSTPLEPESSSGVDIVTVQGLGSHPFYTWVKKMPLADASPRRQRWTHRVFRKEAQDDASSVEEVMWPRDLLPLSFREARIATYSYESDWRDHSIKTSLRQCGEQFLNVLFQHRQRAEERQRPLVLIGHSLGGLVVQQALVIAVHQQAFTDLRLSVAGLIFLGAPFQGSDAAVYSRWLAEASGGDTSLLDVLQKHDMSLRHLSLDFWGSYCDWDIVCFYENKDAAYGPWKTRVVDAQSATLLGKRMMFMDTNHSGLNKFGGVEEENYKLLLREIQRMVESGPSVVVGRHRSNDDSKTDEAEPCSTAPFEADEDFVGRGSILGEMENRLSKPGHHRLALVGPGGVGKTQIAVEFAIRLRKRWPKTWVFWVYASSVATFTQSYREITEAAKMPGRDDPKIDTLDLVSRWMKDERNGPWLMIVDNNDDSELLFTPLRPVGTDQTYSGHRLADYIPRTANGTVIITSRDHRAGSRLCDRKPSIDVERMTASEAKALVSKKLHVEETEAAALSLLLERLENLPLAITQAIAFISENEIGIAEYLDLLTKSEAESIKLLSTNHEDGRRYSQIPHSVINSWRLSFDFIEKREPHAAKLLSEMCFLNRQSIPRRLLLGEEDDGVDFTKALAPLKAFRFVVTDKSGQDFAMHSLVQLSTKAWLAVHGETELYKERALEKVSEAFPLGEHENWVLCQQLLPHAEAVLTYELDSGVSSACRTELLRNLSKFYSERGQYKSAFTLLKEIYDKAVEDKGREHPDTLVAMGNLAKTYSDLGETQEAKKLQIQVLELRKKILGEKHPDTLLAMGNLASTYSDLGETQEAKKLEIQILELRKKILGEKHPETLLAMGNLASTYSDLGETQEAKKLAIQVLELRKKILGEKHPDTLLAMGNLAKTYSDLGETQEAKKLAIQVLELRKKILGEKHPNTLLAMSNLASTYSDLGEAQEAKKLAIQVLELRKKILGEKHPDTLLAMGNLASTYSDLGETQEAKKLEIQVLKLKKKILGEEHPSTLIAMGNLAKTYSDLGETQEAKKLAIQVLELRKKILGEKHPNTLLAMSNLASTYSDLGEAQEAKKLAIQVLELRKKILGEKHPDTLLAMGNLASTYSDLGETQEAKKLAIQVLELRKKILGEKHPDTLLAMGNLAKTYSDLGETQEAKKLAIQVLKLSKKILGEEHPKTLSAMGNLASTYSDLGETQEAKKLQIQVLELRKKILGEEHPDTLSTMGNLAKTYSDLGEAQEAKKLEIQVLKLKKKILGEEHPSTLIAMGNLAKTYSDVDETQEAKKLEIQVLKLRKKILGEEHPSTLIAMGNLASTYSDLGETQEAKKLKIQVLELRKKILGEKHPHTLLAMGNLASTYSDLGEAQEAKTLEVQMLELKKKTLSEEDPDCHESSVGTTGQENATKVAQTEAGQ